MEKLGIKLYEAEKKLAEYKKIFKDSEYRLKSIFSSLVIHYKSVEKSVSMAEHKAYNDDKYKECYNDCVKKEYDLNLAWAELNHIKLQIENEKFHCNLF